jgi:hypothetical protein
MSLIPVDFGLEMPDGKIGNSEQGKKLKLFISS